MAAVRTRPRVNAMLPNRDIDVDSGLEDYGLSEDELDDQSMEDVSGPLETDIEEDVGYAGSTRSLSEQVVQVVHEYGRRYANHPYILPNDEAEQTRLNIIHQIYLILLDGQLTVTPIPPSVERILDVGSGPGDWAVAVGEQFPEAEIIATDISVFDSPMGTIAPPNVYFQIDDAEQEWTYHEPFDVIHARNLSHAITDWAEFYAQAYRHLVPGGTLYVADTNLTTRCLRVPNDSPNSYLHIFLSAVESAAESAKLPSGLDHMSPGVLAAAGFTNARIFDRNVPIGTWPSDNRGKTLGKMGLIALLESLEAVSLRLLTTYAGWTVEDVTDLCNQVKREIVTWQGATCTVRFAVATRPT